MRRTFAAFVALFGFGLVGFGPCDPPTGCAATTRYDIGTGDNAASVVNAHGAGSTYIIKAGTHTGNFSVTPKTGDYFCGESGAILDGNNAVAHAFVGSNDNVTLDGFTVQRYATGFQGAAIGPNTDAAGWVVRNVTASSNYWAGLAAGNQMHILGGHFNDNGQLGISGNSATGIVLDGLDADLSTFDGPELARNHVLHETCQFEGGGIKWDAGSITIRGANVHDNDCRGIWGDINTHDALIENNRVQNNDSEGIVIEISQDATIRNNLVYGNGNAYPPANGWYWNAGILASASFNIDVYGNHLSGNYNGITGVQQDRFDSTPPAHLLDHFHVHDNLICATGAGGHPTGVVADNGANLATRDITFVNNTVQSGACF